MSVLTLNKNGNVDVVESSKGVPEVIDLFKTDKHSGKPFFNSVITYAYYMYKAGGPYEKYGPAARSQMISKKFLDGQDPKKFLAHKKAKAFIDFYYESELSMLERSMESIKKDLEETIEKLHNVPWSIKKKVKLEVDIPVNSGSSETVPYIFNDYIEIPNDSEKFKSMEAIDKLYGTMEKLQNRIDKQRTKGQKVKSRSIFDH